MLYMGGFKVYELCLLALFLKFFSEQREKVILDTFVSDSESRANN